MGALRALNLVQQHVGPTGVRNGGDGEAQRSKAVSVNSR